MRPAPSRTKRWDPRNPLEALIICDTLLAELTPRYTEAIAHLEDLQPGHSGRPAGTGDPGGGTAFSTTSVVERIAERTIELGPPAARRHLEDLQQFPTTIEHGARKVITAIGGRPPDPPTNAHAGQRLTWAAWVIRLCIDHTHNTGTKLPEHRVERLHERVCKLHDRIFTVCEPHPPEQRKTELAADRTEMYCQSCLRVGQREDRSDRYDGLCRWCGDFNATQGFLPTLDLLDAHHDGRKITMAMIALEKPRKKKTRKHK